MANPPHSPSPPPIPGAAPLHGRVIERLQAAGFVAYLAGGCVRDRLMGRPPKDFDVATSALPEQVLKLFPRSQQVGAAFGVILVRERGAGKGVEVATFRADAAYSDGRHPDAVRFTSPEEDARRRDFTCNGLFFDPLADGGRGVLQDFVGGQADIQARVLRAIGDPLARFGEDHLRLLRAVRFAARLDFAIEEQTRAGIAALQKKLALISRERIGEELRMMLEDPTRVAAMTLLASFPRLFEEALGFPPGDGVAFPVLGGLPAQASRATALMALLLDVAGQETAADLLATLRTRLVLSNDESQTLAWLAAAIPKLEEWEDLSKAATKRLMAHPAWADLDALYRADPAHAEQLLAYSERTASLAEEGIAPPPFVTGETLIALGVPPGKRFKGWLEQLYDRQLEGELASAEAALAAARQLVGGDPG